MRDEHQRQGAATVTVRNIITSMRLISDVDWTELFERISLVDDVLAAAGAFPEHGFPTRNLYRSAVEELARGSDHTEIEIARRAVLAADKLHPPARSATEDRQSDPGYHLLGGGRRRVRGGRSVFGLRRNLAWTSEPVDWHRRLCRRCCNCRLRLSSPCHCSRSPPLGCDGGMAGLLAGLSVPFPPSTRRSRW